MGALGSCTVCGAPVRHIEGYYVQIAKRMPHPSGNPKANERRRCAMTATLCDACGEKYLEASRGMIWGQR